jgi:hypothetical protein
VSANPSSYAPAGSAPFWTAIARVARAAGRLVRSWWSADRIRAAPGEGRLLRLRPGDFVVLDERVAEVVGRGVGQGAAGPFVVYDCQTARGSAQIRVSTAGSVCSSRIHWIENGVEQILKEGDLEVWCR